MDANAVRSWYDTPERLGRLQLAADSWLGTPWGQNSRVKGPGGGVSCQTLTGALHIEAGLLEEFDIPAAPMNWALHNKESLVVPYMRGRPEFAEIWTFRDPPKGEEKDWAGYAKIGSPRLLPGDVLGIKVQGCVHHMATVVDRFEVLEAWMSEKVVRTPFNQRLYLRNLRHVWRPVWRQT